jgi:lysophospholipase L1-like esterase
MQALLKQPSSWEGNFYYRELATGGTAIATFESQFPTNASPLLQAGGFGARYYFLWGGHNDAGYYSSDESTRETLISRYVAILEDAAELGAKPVIITPLLSISRTAAEQAAQGDYVAELKTACAASSATIYVVDAHNIPQLVSQDTRPNTYFDDAIHLTNAGYELVRALIVSTIGAP